MPDNSKTLSLVFEYSTDKASANQVKGALDDIDKGAKKAEQSVKRLGDAVDQTARRGGASLKTLTKALDDDLARGASNAKSKMDEVDLVGRKLEALGRQVGGSWGDALTTIGGALGSIADSADLLQGLKGLGGLKGGLGGIGGLSALGIGAAGLAGAGLGVAGYEGLRAAGVAKGASSGQFASVAAYEVGSLFGEETAQKWFKSVAEAVGELPAPAEKATAAIKQMAAAAEQAAPKLDAFHTVGQVASGLGVNLPDANTIQLNTFGGGGSSKKMEELQKQRDFESDRLKLIRDSRDEELKAEADYNRERQQSIAKFNLDTRQLEKQHAVDMRRMREDANQRLNGLAIERDAVSYLQDWQASQTAQKRAEEDFGLGQGQRKKQFDLQMQQQQQDFDAMQAERRKQAGKQLDDLRAAMEAENEIRADGYNKAIGAARDFRGAMGDLFDSFTSARRNLSSQSSSNYYYVDGNGRQSGSNQNDFNRRVDGRISRTIGSR